MSPEHGGGLLRLVVATWPEVEAALRSGRRTALFAVGSTEQHGPHLPLGTDTIIGDALCAAVATELGGGVVAPSVPVGLSGIHMDFPGSLNVTDRAVREIVEGYCRSLAGHGFSPIVVIPSHGGNFAVVEEVVRELRPGIGATRVVTYTDWPRLRAAFVDVLAADGLTIDAPGLHAGEVETSIMLHLDPALVRMHLAAPGYVGSPGNGRPYSTSIREASPIGVLGDPRPASPARGARYLAVWAHLIAAAVMEKGVVA